MDISLSPSFQLHNLLFSRGALCFHKIASSLFLNVPAPLSHYSCLLVFFFLAVLRFRGLHFLLSPLLHQFPQPPPFFHTQVYICVHGLSISVMDLNTFPPSLHPRFLFLFLSSFSHVGLLLSCPPYCQSAFTHPAFISISPQGDLGRTHLLSLYRSQSTCLNSSAFPF